MARVGTTKPTLAGLATSRVMDADIDRINAGGESFYGAKASFIPIDLATPESIRESHDDGFAVVIVDEHENVRVLPAPDPSLGERERDRFWRELGIDW